MQVYEQASRLIGRHAGRPIGMQSNRLAGLLAGRTGGRTVAEAVVGLLVGPAKWEATGRARRVVGHWWGWPSGRPIARLTK